MSAGAGAPEELHAFAVFSSGPAYTFAPSRPAAFEAWLRRSWETGTSRPEWCFVTECGARYVGSLVYHGDGHPGDVAVVRVHLGHAALEDHQAGTPLAHHGLEQPALELEGLVVAVRGFTQANDACAGQVSKERREVVLRQGRIRAGLQVCAEEPRGPIVERDRVRRTLDPVEEASSEGELERTIPPEAPGG